jgi:hypothetical protein
MILSEYYFNIDIRTFVESDSNLYFMAIKIQLTVFWVMTPFGGAVRYKSFASRQH